MRKKRPNVDELHIPAGHPDRKAWDKGFKAGAACAAGVAASYDSVCDMPYTLEDLVFCKLNLIDKRQLRKNKRRPTVHSDFFHGVLAALAVVHIHDNPTIYGEIVDSVGYEQLRLVANEAGDLQWSGLKKYGKDLRRAR